MDHVRLGSTGLDVSRLCLGTMTFGLQCDEPSSVEILDRAYEAGITFLDAVDVYPLGGGPETAGRTEEIIGRWRRDRRADVVIATKCFGSMTALPWDKGSSRKHIREAVDGSLRRLQVEAIDLYQLHGDDPTVPLDETLSAREDLVRAGKVHYIGVSNWPAWRLALALGSRTSTRFESVQPRYNLLFRAFERDLFPLAQAEGLAVIPYNPLAGGLLTGKHSRETIPEGRFRLGAAGPMYQQRYWNDAEFETVEALRPLAKQAGITMAHMAIGWTLAKPWVTAPIIGASTPAHLDDALTALDKPLDPSLIAQLDELTAHYRLSDAPR